MQFLIYDDVKIKLTEMGIDIYKKKHDGRKPKIDNDGYFTDSLVNIMADFGPELVMFQLLPFEPVFALEKKTISEKEAIKHLKEMVVATKLKIEKGES